MEHECDKCYMKPGSDTAKAKGCVCPTMDNGRGHNVYRMVIHAGCTVHGAQTQTYTLKEGC